ncbi:MAG: NAD-dependent epimerase/dehydratase family protein, partial [Solirubrobacteraceae bacterium]
MSTTFVTGAYGMLGTWLVRALLERGERVVVLRRNGSTGSALAHEGL